MANRSWKRNIATLDNELVLYQGVIHLSGSTTGSNQNVGISHSITGSGAASVTRLATGSYRIRLDDSFVGLRSAQFELFPYSNLTTLRIFGDKDRTIMSGSTGKTEICFNLLSGSTSANPVAYDPTGSIDVHVSLRLKNSSV